MNVCIALEGILMILFRNNAMYAVAVAAVFLLIFCSKKERLSILLMSFVLIAGGKGAQEGIRAALGTEIQGSKSEMYSVPMVQFARVGFYHGSEMDAEIFNLIEPYVGRTFWSGYIPAISDRIKSGVAAYQFEDNWEPHMDKVLQNWTKVGMKYPNEYIDAFLEITRGYWFMDDTSYAEMLGSGVEGRMGALYTYNVSKSDFFEGIEHISKFPWLEKQLEKIVSGNSFYQWPIVSQLFKTATYSWLLLLIVMSYFYKRQRKQILISLYPLFYMGTMLLGPTVQVRYIYPIMISIPILLAMLYLDKTDRV